MNLSVAETQTPVYLGMCRELTEIYRIRQNLVTQYRTALGVLLALGGLVSIFFQDISQNP